MSEKYYVAGCVDNGLDVDQVEDQDAEFWTLYARDVNGESEGIIDFRFREDAFAAMAVYVERDALSELVRTLQSDVNLSTETLNNANEIVLNAKAAFDGITTENDALKEQVRALAAENLSARNSVTAFSEATIDLTEVIGDEIGMDGVRRILAGFEAVGNMPATDAILNEVRAQAVEDFAEVNKAEWLPAYIEALVQHATRIRAGEVPIA